MRRHPDWFLRAALRLQRLHGLVPSTKFSRSLSAQLATWARPDPAGPLQDDHWSAPLVARGVRSRNPGERTESHAGERRTAPTSGGSRVAEAARGRGGSVAAESPGTSLSCLLVTDSLDVGGLQEVVALLSRGLPSLGISTEVVTSRRDRTGSALPQGWTARQLVETGVSVLALQREELAGHLARRRPDVLSLHMAPPWVLDVAEQFGIPVVDTLHNTVLGLHNEDERERERARSKRVAHFVTVSDLARQQYLTYVPELSLDQIETIPNCLHTERLHGFPDRDSARARFGLDDEFLLVCLARHAVQKNLFGLVSAFGEVARIHPNAHLLVAGPVDDLLYKSQVDHLRSSLPARNRIHLRGHCPEPSVMLAAADCFVLDSFFEGWPIATMEALAAGVPVVMSEVGGAYEQVGTDGSRGRVVANPLGDPRLVNDETIRPARYKEQVNQAELVAGISSILRDGERWAAARQQLRAESRQRFHPSVFLERYAGVLRGVAGQA